MKVLEVVPSLNLVKLFGVEHCLGVHYQNRVGHRSPKELSGGRGVCNPKEQEQHPKSSVVFDLRTVKAQDCDEPLIFGPKNIAICQLS